MLVSDECKPNIGLLHDAQGGGADELSKDDSGQTVNEPTCLLANGARKAVVGGQGDVHKHGFNPHVVENLVQKEYQPHFRRRAYSIIP